ncbi:hypothetical protein [Methylomonas sp. AM2-LC]
MYSLSTKVLDGVSGGELHQFTSQYSYPLYLHPIVVFAVILRVTHAIKAL